MNEEEMKENRDKKEEFLKEREVVLFQIQDLMKKLGIGSPSLE